MTNFSSLPDAQNIQQGVTYLLGFCTLLDWDLSMLFTQFQQQLRLYLEDNTGDTRHS